MEVDEEAGVGVKKEEDEKFQMASDFDQVIQAKV